MQLKDLANLTDTLQILNKSENIADTFNSLSLSTQKAVLASGQLSAEQLNLIATSNIFSKSANGSKVAVSGLTLEEVKNAASNALVAESQTTTTGTTFGLGKAFKDLGIKIQKATASLWTFLTTTPTGWASLIVGAMAFSAFIVKKYNDSIAKAKENARERTSELFDEFKEMNDTLADHKKTVAELADRYDELSKGVNLSNNKNISLSSEEYEEFLKINEQLADSFPELNKGIDKNGNSILNIGTKGITAKEQLEELLKTEEDLNNFRIAQGLEDAFKGVYTYIEDANKATNAINDSLNRANESIDALKKISEDGIDLRNTEVVIRGSGNINRRQENLIFNGAYGNNSDVAYMNTLKASAEDFFNTLSDERRKVLNGRYAINPKNLFDIQTDSRNGTFEIYARLFELTDDEIKLLQSIIEDNISFAMSEMTDEFSDQLQESQEEIQKAENAWHDFIPSLVAGMRSKQTFKDLDSDLQDIAIKIVEGLDTSYATAMDVYDPDPYAYIRDKLIVPMGNLSDTDQKNVKDAFAKLMTLDANDISDKNREEITKLIQTINDILEIDDFNLKVALGFDVGDDIKNRLENSIRQITDDHGLSDREEYADLSEYTKDFTAEQAKLWLEATLGAENATQAIEMYEAALADVTEAVRSTPLSITETVDQLNTQIKPAFDSLKSAWQDIFTDDGFALNSIDILSTCDSIKSKLDDMSELGLSIDYSSYEDFVSVLRNSESTEQDVKDAFDSLATSITKAGLSGVEDFETMNAALEDLGVVNNEIVAFQALISNTDILAETVKQAGLTMDEFVISTEDGTIAASDAAQAFIEEMVGAENCEQALALLQLQQMIFNENGLDTAQDINSCYQLAQAAGIATEAIAELAGLSTAYESVSAAGNTHAAAAIASQMEAVRARVQTQFAELSEVDFSGVDKSKSSKSSSKDTAETFDWIEQAITNVENEIKELDGIANSSYSTLSEKNEALAQEMSKVNDEIDLQKQAYDEYMRKAESIDLADQYKQLIQNGAVHIEDISDERLKNRISEYQKWYDKAQDAQNQIDDLHEKSNDLHVASYENEVKDLEALRDTQSISEREYLDRMSALWERYYANQVDLAIQAKEAKLKLLEEEKDYLASVADAAADLLGDQVDELKDRQDAEIAILEAKKKPLEEQLALLEEQKDKEDRILALQKAQYELKRAEGQRNKLTYVDGQMVYRADESNIRSAKDAVNDAEFTIAKENIQNRINAYDKEIDRIKERYETEISNMEQLKNEWQNVLALQERSLHSVNFESMFGEGSIAKLLTGDLSMISAWKQAYLDTLSEIDLVNSGAIGDVTTLYAKLVGSQSDTTDSQSLAGALKDTYDIASEALPEEAKMMNAITQAANSAVAAINELRAAMTSLSSLSANANGISLLGNAYASGTKHAEKGLALVGEKKPEVIITNNRKAFLAKQPTLLNMEGGETVFDGDETAKMLSAKGFAPITPDEFPLLKALSPYSPDEIMQKFAPAMISPARTAATSAIQNAGHAMNHNSVNNSPSYTMGDVHIHCPGITKDEVAKQIGSELTNVFTGLSLNAYQRANITR